MAPSFADVIKSQYVSLTTFTKDGRPKPTAIWGVPDGDKLLVITDDGSWKVKRIRNTPRVTIAECDRTGKVKGEPVEAVATILDDAHIETVYAAIGNRYGLLGKVFNFFSKLRGGAKRNVGLELRAA